MSFRFLSFVFLALLYTFQSFAQQSQNLHASTRTIGADDGLPITHINAIFEAKDGFIWLGTPRGLYRFDGYRFKPYEKAQHGFGADWTSYIGQDEQGLLWLGHATNMYSYGNMQSIDIFDARTGKSVPLQDYIQGDLPFDMNEVIQLKSDSRKRIWLILTNGKVYLYKHGKLVLFSKSTTDKPHLPDILDLPDGRVAVGYGYRTEILDSLGNLLFLVKNDSALKRCHILGVDNDQQLWIINGELETGDHVCKIDLENYEATFTYTKDHFFLWKPHKGMYWAAKGDQLVIFKGQGELLLSTHSNLAEFEENPESFYINNETLWRVGTESMYIAKMNRNSFKTHFFEKGQTVIGSARGIFYHQSLNRMIAVGTFGTGTLDTRTQEESIFLFDNPKQQKEKYVFRSLLAGIRASDGTCWFGMESVKYSLIQSTAEGMIIQSFADTELKQQETGYFGIWSIYELSSKDLLLGTSMGLYLWKTSERRAIPQNVKGLEALKNQTIFHIAPQRNGKDFWLSTSLGLYAYNLEKGALEHWHSQGENGYKIPHDAIAHTYEDTNGDLYMASKGGGLIHWEKATRQIRQFKKSTGLANDVIYAVYPDDYGNLWLSSDNGIMRFNKSNNTVASFGMEDGLSHREYNTISHFQASDGTIYFGGHGGVTSFHPKDFVEARQAPPLAVAGLSVQDRESGIFTESLTDFYANQAIILHPTDLGFELELGFFDFADAQKASFQYKIVGIDQAWRNLPSPPSVRINALPYGEYTLVARAQSKSGSISEELRIPIKVLKPFYWEWWFISTCVIVFLGSIWLAIRFRIAREKVGQRFLEAQIWDRTKELQRDKQLIEQQAEELKALDGMKSRFFSNISHELRTPLTLIMGPLERLSRKPSVIAAGQSEVVIIHRNAKSLLNLVNNILDLSKLEASRLEIYRKPLDMRVFFEKISSNFESEARHQGIYYHAAIDLPDASWLMADAEKLENILNNLLSNALKFTPKGGSVHLDGHYANDTLTIKLRDTGKGISEEDLPHIFDRYFQTKSKNAPIQGGTGIGLAFAKELAELMGGSLAVQSTLGAGATFLLQLNAPVATPEEEEAETEEIFAEQLPELPLWKQKPLLVLAEDNTDMRQHISSVLESHFSIKSFADGAQAWNFLSEKGQEASLLISDLMMPEMDGFALLQHVKSSPLQMLPVIMLTARVGEYDRLHALRIGVDDYLTKPFSGQELLARAINLVQRHQMRMDAQLAENSLPKDTEETQEEEVRENSAETQAWLETLEAATKKYLKKGQLTVVNVADEIGMSDRQLQRRMKTLLEMSPKDYFLEVQMQIAREHLENGKAINVTTLAKEMGFKNAHYFSQRYEQRFGKRPASYFE